MEFDGIGPQAPHARKTPGTAKSSTWLVGVRALLAGDVKNQSSVHTPSVPETDSNTRRRNLQTAVPSISYERYNMTRPKLLQGHP